MPRNSDPWQPWNDPIMRSDPFAPWNSPMKRDDPFAPWNTPFGRHQDMKSEDREHLRGTKYESRDDA